MIFQESTLASGVAAEDQREKEGYFLVRNATGELAVSAAVTDKPVGVVHIGADKGIRTTYVRPGYGGTVGVKLGTTPGTVNEGTELVLMADGRVKALPSAAGTYIIVATAAEPGEGDQLLEAVLCRPTSVTIS